MISRRPFEEKLAGGCRNRIMTLTLLLVLLKRYSNQQPYTLSQFAFLSSRLQSFVIIVLVYSISQLIFSHVCYNQIIVNLWLTFTVSTAHVNKNHGTRC